MGTKIKLCRDGNGVTSVDWNSGKDVLDIEFRDSTMFLPENYTETVVMDGVELLVEMAYSKHPELDVAEKRVRIRHVQGEPVTVLQASMIVDSPGKGQEWYAAGLGQPAFSGDRYFAAVRHPYGLTVSVEDSSTLELLQHPGKWLEQGDFWESAAFIFGFSPKSGIREIFDTYIHGIAKFRPERVWIYGDWALHDELAEKGRSVELTESMTRENVTFLQQIDRQHGIHFNYYLVDHGWYSKSSFTELKQPNFHFKGLKWLADELETMNVKLGLWFPVNTYSENADGIFCGLIPEGFAGGGGAYCLRSAYGQHLRESMLHAVEQWGIKMIKLDFADFECKDTSHFHDIPPAASDLLPLILREQESNAFLDIMCEMNAKHPDVMIVAFNGFAPSPWWLETIDTLYIGDVQPSAIPAIQLRTSVNLFTEQQLNKYEKDWHIHRNFLDDCGTFIGDTTTNFYLGREDWRSQGLLSLGRGAKLIYYYGDLRLLDEDDLGFLGEIASYDRTCVNTSDTYTIGPDNGKEPFAYINSKYAAVYNPTLKRIESQWNLRTGGSICTTLAPYEAQWIDLADSRVVFTSGGIEALQDGEPLEETMVSQQGDRYTISVDRTAGSWVHYVSFYSQDQPVRSMKPSELCRVESNYPIRIVPDHFVWNGIPWLAVVVNIPDRPDPESGAAYIQLDLSGVFSGCSIRGESWWIPVAEKEA
jgi:hypothetical protein